ncbi:hypothetical protein [Marinitenerispora sediminis]|uniref:hypothetical protein n=1 Tax=Marinitenerispora sediminis TaxID=1931232 RepID=UPI0011C02C41|nr:hypothetical protein [Marinitenerispora sediminis]
MKTILRRITLAGLIAPAIALGTPAMAGAQDIFGGEHFWGWPSRSADPSGPPVTPAPPAGGDAGGGAIFRSRVVRRIGYR